MAVTVRLTVTSLTDGDVEIDDRLITNVTMLTVRDNEVHIVHDGGYDAFAVNPDLQAVAVNLVIA